MPPAFDNLVNKVKSVTKQAADSTAKIAKIGKLKTNVMTLKSEKGRHLSTIGLRAYTLFTENNKIDGVALQEKVRDEIAQIERIESRIREIESEIADLQASTQHVDVTDVTEEEEKSNMRKIASQITLALLVVAGGLGTANNAWADAISPAITGSGQMYSKEAPNSAYFGTGVAGRLTESSSLRFEGEQDTMAGNYDIAIAKLAKATQLDPADPTNHLLYARALTAKVRTAKQPDLAQVQLAIAEWKLIWHHDADLLEQVEGRRQAWALSRFAKQIIKREKETSLVAQKKSAPTN